MHFKKSVLKNHLLYSIITLMAIAMLFPITAFAQAYVQTWDLVDSGMQNMDIKAEMRKFIKMFHR